MKATITAIALFLACCIASSNVSGQEKVKRTEKEIRDDLKLAKSKVSELEIELATVVMGKVYKLPDEKFDLGDTYKLVSQRGLGATIKIVEIVDSNSAIITLQTGSDKYSETFLMMMPTKGLVDGSLYQEATQYAWKFTKTEKVKGRTVIVLENSRKLTDKDRD